MTVGWGGVGRIDLEAGRLLGPRVRRRPRLHRRRGRRRLLAPRLGRCRRRRGGGPFAGLRRGLVVADPRRVSDWPPAGLRRTLAGRRRAGDRARPGRRRLGRRTNWGLVPLPRTLPAYVVFLDRRPGLGAAPASYAHAAPPSSRRWVQRRIDRHRRRAVDDRDEA